MCLFIPLSAESFLINHLFGYFISFLVNVGKCLCPNISITFLALNHIILSLSTIVSISQCHIQRKFGDIGFSRDSWGAPQAELWWGLRG